MDIFIFHYVKHQYKSNTDLHSERANADIAQLLRRFENIIAFTPVSIAFILKFIMTVFEMMLVEFGSDWDGRVGVLWYCVLLRV